MKTTVTALIAIVISIITVVAIFAATDTIFTDGIIDLEGFTASFIDCISGDECELFGGQ